MSHCDCSRPFFRTLWLPLLLTVLVGFETPVQGDEPAGSDSKTAEPAAVKSPAAKPAATTPAPAESEGAASTPAKSAPTKPPAAEPPPAKPETAKPETAKPETAKPETAKPETAKPETAKPETAKPETAKPETAKPETAKPKRPEPRLRFNFRYQRWSDVLEWFADQADLSLVLDAPPPGTFNYTDSRTYSPTEAIDLLNSVLLTKGFTLVRRERMLMVLDLRGGVPEGTIPRVMLDDLDKHGKFELVSTMFPLNGRDAQAVNDEISVLLGPYGRSVPLPQTKQILVTDRAGIMKTIARMIESMPIPPTKPVPPKPPVPEKPELRVYPVKSVDPQSVIDVVTILIPEIKIVADPKTHKLSVYAGPSQHAVVKSVLDQMEADNTPAMRPQLKVYPLNVADLTKKELKNLETTFALMVPSARLRIDSDGGKLVAWATAEDQAILDAALKQIGGDTLLPETRQLAVYRLTKADPESTLSLLKSLLPKATLVIDSQTGSLIAVATPNDHKAIASVLEEVQPKEPSPNTPQLQIYAIERPLPESVSALFAKLVPQADITVDNEDKRVMAVATPNDQAVIRSTLDDLQKTVGGNESYELIVYRIALSQLDRVRTMLDTLVSAGGNAATPELDGVKIVPDENRGELAIWARPAQHKIIGKILDELKRGTTEYEEGELQAYSITAADPESLMSMLEKLYPSAKLSLDAKTHRILAWAPPAMQKSIGASIEQMLAGAADAAKHAKVYHLTKALPTDVTTILSHLVPNAETTVNEKKKQLIVVATPDEQTLVQKTIDELEGSLPEQGKRQLVAYPIKTAEPQSVLSMLETLYVDTTFVLDDANHRLIVWADPKTHTSIKASLEQMQVDKPSENQPRFESYPLYGANSSEVTQRLQSLLPNVRISVDASGTKLIAWGTPLEQTQLKAALQELQQGQTLATTKQIEVYHLTKADPATTLQLLEKLLPNAQMFLDSQTRSLIALAVPTDQQIIRTTLEQLQPNQPGPDSPQLRFYPLTKRLPENVTTILSRLVPDAQVTVDQEDKQLMVVATPADHLIVKSTLEEVEKALPDTKERQLIVYPVTPAQRKRFDAVLSTVTSELPGITIIKDAEPGELSIWAKPSQHSVIAGIISELQRDVPETEKYQLVAYPVKSADLATATSLLESMFPETKIVVDDVAKRLLIWTRLADQARIKSAIEQLQTTQPGPNSPQLRFYPLTKRLPENVTTILSRLVPDAQVTVDQEDKQLMVVATPADHLIVKSTLEEVEKALPDKEERQLIVYPVTPAQRKRFDAVLSTVTSELPGITIIKDAEPGELSIWAKPSQHSVIAGIVSELQRDVPETEKYQLVAYPLKSVDPETATSLLKNVFPETKIVVDEDTDRLLIWTRPADHARIKAAIEQLDSGQPVDRTEGFMVYPVKDSDAQVVLQVLQELLPKVKFVQDRTAGTIIAWAKKKDHDLITRTLEKLQAGPDEKYKPKLEVYSVGAADATAISTFLQTAVPEARITVDTTSGVLMAWAAPDDQETIRATVEKMSEQTGGSGGPKMVVYTLESTGAVSAYTILRQAFPRMVFTYSTSDRTKLIAWGSAADHKLVRQVVDQLEDDSAYRKGLDLKVYDVTALGAQAATQVLATVVPKVTFTTGTDPNRLIAWAKPEDHALIEKILKQLADENLKHGDREMQVYTLSKADLTSATQILQDSVPGAKFLNDRAAGTIIAWANKTDHEKIAALLKKLDAGPDEQHKPALQVYPLGKADGAAVSRFLQFVAPTARISVDTNTGNLMVWATPEEQKNIRTTVERMVEQAASQPAPQIVVYDMPALGAISGYSVMQSLFPHMQFSYSSDRRKLIAWGPAEEQVLVKQIIEQLEQDAGLRKDVELKVYDVRSVGASTARQMLSEAVPKAKFTTTAVQNKLIVWAVPEDHAKIEKILKVLPVAPKMTSKVYRLEHANLSAAYSVLRSLVPQATIAMDTTSNALVVSALPNDQAKIQATVAELDREDAEHSPTLVVYPVENADATTLSTFLRSVVPNARVTVDTQTGNLMVWATPAEHVTIRSTIDEVVAHAGEGAGKVVVYDVEATGATNAYYVLRRAFPRMEFTYSSRTPSRLVVWGSAKDHEKVRQVIDQLEDVASQQADFVVKSYDVKSIGTSGARQMLAGVVPKATLTTGTDPNTLIVWANPKDHALIEQIVNDLPPASEVISKVYRLEHANLSAAYSALRSLVPQATIAMDTTNNALVVSALPEDQTKIQATVAELDREDAEHSPTLVVYPVENADATTLSTFLRSVVPNARVTVDTQTGNLMVWATPAEHVTIRSTIDEVVAHAGEGAGKVVVYDVEATGATNAYYILRRAFPRMEFTYSSRTPSTLVVWGSAKDHEKVQQVVDQLEAAASQQGDFVVKSYDVESIGTAGAQQMLAGVVPKATLTTGTDPDTLIVWASPEDHALIEQIVNDLPPVPEVISKVYRLEHANLSAAYSALRSLVPQATIAMDATNNALVVSALPDDQAKIQATVAELDREDAEHSPTLVVYPVGHADPSVIRTFLTSAVPNARFTVDENSGNLMAWATPAEQVTIRTTVEEMVKQTGAGGTGVVIYDVTRAGARNAYYVLRSAFPNMRFTYSTRDDSKLVAWGSTRDHEDVAALVKQLEDAASQQAGYEVKSYNVEAIGATRAESLLEDVAPKATFTSGSDPDTLIVWASPEEHALIEQLVSQLPPAPQTVARVYRLEHADVRAVSTALQSLVPKAVVAMDRTNSSVVVSALPDDQKKVAATIQELDRQDAENSPKFVVYPVQNSDPSTIANFLGNAVPNARITVDEDSGNLMVWATPTEHATIKATVDEMTRQTGEAGTNVVVYNVSGTGARNAYYVLRYAFPRSHFNYSTRDDSKLVAWGPAKDLEMAQKIIDQLENDSLLKSGLVLKVYDVQGLGAKKAEDMLENVVPRASFTIGRDPNKLIVWAKPEDHAVIEQTIKDLPPLPETISRVYYLRRTDPEAAQTVLSAMVPLAEMAVDEENRSLVVNATAEDHAKLKAAIDEMDRERPDAPTPRVEIHPFKIADPMDIYNALRALYRYRKDVQLSLDAHNDTLLAVAPPDDQQKIRDLIATVEAAGAELRKDMTVKVYDVESVGAANARQLLQRTVPKAEFTTGDDPNKLIVRAKAQDHALIEQIIKELPSLPETSSRIYYLRKADPEAALAVLEKLTPDAEMAVDDQNHSLIVSATAEDHAKLEAAVNELEREHPNDPSPRVATYRTKTADVSSIYTVLRSLYRKRNDVQLSLDELHDTLIAVAPPEEHKKIRELIDSVEQTGTVEGPEKIAFYSMENMDADAVLTLVQKLLEEQGSKAHVSLAPRSEQLIVMARPEIQDMIQKALEGFQTKESVLEVYQLEMIDPFTAELAIGHLFGTEGTQPAPIVDSDATTQRLFVRATEEQQANIRDLLVKMGETGLTIRRGEAVPNTRLRVVPFDGDSAQAVEEIKRIWSQLRSNPIQVIKPSSVPLQKPNPSGSSDSGTKEASPSKQTDKPSISRPSAPKSRDNHSSVNAFDFNTALAEVGLSDAGLAVGKKPAHSNGKADVPKAAEPKAPEASAGEPKTNSSDTSAPVIVVPGADSVTITCDDPEALSQFENLLRALSGHTGLVGRNLIVLALRNVTATTVADTLNQLYREDKTGFGISTGPVTVVPDERLNAVIVHANRADRATIRSLVQVLDTAEIPDSQAIKRPMLIPVKNTDAERIESVLRTIYKTHLTASSGRSRSMPIPRGIPSKLANALQQMNATTSGPLMTIAVEEKSNSLVVMAPSQLLEEVRLLVEELDRVAIDENSRKIAIIPLKKVDTSRLQQALDLFHRGSTGNRRRSSSRSSSRPSR